MLTQGTKVLITGGAGFLGSHVARALVRLRAAKSACSTTSRPAVAIASPRSTASNLLQADVRNPAAVHRAMQGVQAVIHLAGVQPGVDPIRAHRR